jgi:hypothetical protein
VSDLCCCEYLCCLSSCVVNFSNVSACNPVVAILFSQSEGERSQTPRAKPLPQRTAPGTTQPRVEVVIAQRSTRQLKGAERPPFWRQKLNPTDSSPRPTPFTALGFTSPPDSSTHTSRRTPTNELERPDQDRRAGMDSASFSPVVAKSWLTEARLDAANLQATVQHRTSSSGEPLSFPHHSRRLPLVWDCKANTHPLHRARSQRIPSI